MIEKLNAVLSDLRELNNKLCDEISEDNITDERYNELEYDIADSEDLMDSFHAVIQYLIYKGIK